jgi:hypothetical protein
MDKSWIMKPRGSDAYEQGVIEFIKFAFKDEKENSEIICPCELCGFKKPQSRSRMSDHLSWSPFPKGYKKKTEFYDQKIKVSLLTTLNTFYLMFLLTN